MKKLVMENFDEFTDEITRSIIYCTDLETRNGIIVGPDKNPVVFNNKYMSYPAYTGYNKNVTAFNPVSNPKMASMLLQMFLKIWQIDMYGCSVIQGFFLSPVDENGYGSAICKFDNGTTISSIPLINESLRYIDLMLRISESDFYDINTINLYDQVYRQKKIDGEC